MDPVKTCIKCKQEKPLIEFHRIKTSADGHRGTCKVCVKEYDAKKWDAKGDEIKAQKRAWYHADPERRRAENERSRKWRIANPQKFYELCRNWRQAHQEHVNARQRKHRKANADKYPAYDRNAVVRRRRLMKQLTGSHTRQQWTGLQKLTGNKCLRCGSEDALLTKDHIIPIDHPDSTNDIWNIQPLCSSCNVKKGNQIIDYRPEWMRNSGTAIPQESESDSGQS